MKKVLPLSLIVTLIMSLFFVADGEVSASKNGQYVQTVAHRGASGYAPENTMAAFEKAVKMKADYIEIDVQQTKDGELIVIHDTSVERTTDGSGMVKDLTLEELKQLDAGSWFGEEFAGEKLPTLAEVLDAYRGKSGILIELKSPSLYPGIEENVVAELTKRNMDKPNNNKIILQSFDHESVETFHSILPSVPTGVLVSYTMSDNNLRDVSRFADYVNPGKWLITSDYVDRIHDNGMLAQTWTVRDKESVEPLIQAGVDGIITDYPDYVNRR
ncbi:glycerophosphodiester phosphodiesterase family protein [Alkalihalobacillus macyae]|uniref:glycerophosphodiester phosphodiesterase n=1 Tax=Guptibacillus hwajinpoensis TaxID=208199 RepID=UPI00273C3238|nr:glycerophosphodiester phosphodiesterase family protein [Alkalihalobacillus macyae]MDP4549529.1 glycerophosphodiester phosphodiesterase family protein [Alkalihalobacillus macyae]